MFFSFICASRSPEKAGNWKRGWNNIMAGRDSYELIVVENAPSICAAYKDGERKAIAHCPKDEEQILIFVHDDVVSLTQDFAPRLIRHFETGADVVGGAGADKAIGDKWFLAGPPHVFGQVLNYMPAGKGQRPRARLSTDAPNALTMEEVDVPAHFSLAVFGVPKRLVRNCCIADGFFIAAKPGVLRWDTNTYSHFHMYDCDASFDAFLQGYQVAIATDLCLLHMSQGGYGQPEWAVEAPKFLKKWEKELPPQPPIGNPFNTTGRIYADLHTAVNDMERFVARTEM